MIMAIVERNRILRPSTRLASSISYKINTEKVSGLDELIVRVYSEQKRLIAEFHFAGRDIAGKDLSISDISMSELTGENMKI